MRALLSTLFCLCLFECTFAAIRAQPSVLIEWNNAVLQGIKDSKIEAPISARDLAVVHTCTYDAWAAYDEHAVGTQLGGALRRPASERTPANKEKAISYAAYRALADLLPADVESVYKPLMKQLGYDPNDKSTDIETPAGIGNVACAAVLEFRHHDKSNQLGDLAEGAYSDWTHFSPVNMPIPFPVRLPSAYPIDMNHWQPLLFVDSAGNFTSQMFTTAHWRNVTPFALSSSDEFRDVAKSFPPATYGSPEYGKQAEELVKISGELNDEKKMIAEYWSDSTETVPMRWNRFAQWVSARDHHSLDDDVKMFFVLNNALLDSSIAAWDTKQNFDSIRPVTAIPLLYQSKKIRAWAGPGKGAAEINGSNWIPYQAASLPTPPSPEYVSGPSTFSSAAAAVLSAWTGNDHFGDSVTFAAGSSKIEPGTTPAKTIMLHWDTFTDAAEQAGLSGLYAGIHFRQTDLAGQKLGRMVAAKALAKAQDYFHGTGNR